MKQSTFKQLLLLAVFLFAGIGSAFGQDETYHVTINRVDASTGNAYPETFSVVRLIFLAEDGSGYYSNTGFDILGGENYRLYVENWNPDMYTVTSIEINGTTYENPGQYVYTEETYNYIEIPNLSSDITATLTIAKAPTKIVRVYRDPALVTIYLLDGKWYGVNPITWDDEKIEFEVLEGSSCQLDINNNNQLAYSINSVSVGDEDVTADFERDGWIQLPSINEDKVVTVGASKLGDTKTISMSMDSDDGDSWWHGSVIFHDPSRYVDKYYYDDTNTELLVGSTTQMKINTDLGWKVKTMTVDGTDVTDTYYSQGYYEFKNLDADHSVAVTLETAEIYKITVDRDRIPDDIWVYVYRDDWWTIAFGNEYQYNERSFFTLRVPVYVWDVDDMKFGMRILDGGTDVTPNSPDEYGYYNYTISNLSSDHQISLDYETLPSVTVNCIYNNETYNNSLYFTLNNENPGLGRPWQFDKGSDVTFSLREISDDKVVESIKVDGNDITSSFNGSYVLSNLTEDHVITITLRDAEEPYQLCARFDDLSTGKIYLKQAKTEKTENSCMRFEKGSVATIIVKAPIGHEVSKIHLVVNEVVYNNDGDPVSNEREEDAEILYNPDTKEYYCDVTVNARTYAVITTQKKPADGTTEISYTLDSSGMATFCSEYDLDFSSEATKDIAAYVAIGFDTETKKLTMMRVTSAQRGTGLLIVGKPGSYTIPVKATSLNYHNMLKAVGEDTNVRYSECWDICYNNYVLSGSVFTKADETPISAYQAYLQISRSMVSGTQSISLEFIEMGDMNGDAKITITDAVMIVDRILNKQ